VHPSQTSAGLTSRGLAAMRKLADVAPLASLRSAGPFAAISVHCHRLKSSKKMHLLKKPRRPDHARIGGPGQDRSRDLASKSDRSVGSDRPNSR